MKNNITAELKLDGNIVKIKNYITGEEIEFEGARYIEVIEYLKNYLETWMD